MAAQTLIDGPIRDLSYAKTACQGIAVEEREQKNQTRDRGPAFHGHGTVSHFAGWIGREIAMSRIQGGEEFPIMRIGSDYIYFEGEILANGSRFLWGKSVLRIT